jgi:hypothetical protein
LTGEASVIVPARPGAAAFGAADGDDAACHLEAFGCAVAETLGHGQENQGQVVEVPAHTLARLGEAMLGLLPGGRGEKLPQASGHRLGAARHALRSRSPFHKPFLLIGLGKVSRDNSERLVLSPPDTLRRNRFWHCMPSVRDMVDKSLYNEALDALATLRETHPGLAQNTSRGAVGR